ncbi:hypothetical protein [Bacteroides heparinolyticus]|uniref:hypothetical protein n=1 Tax=Prevotella heparinolytica TaxID=28113 RepID=UPI0035A01CF3
MEDFFKFLLVMSVIVIGIVKQFKKEAQKNADKKPAMPMPEANFPLPEYQNEDTDRDFIPEEPETEPEFMHRPSAKPNKQPRHKKQPFQSKTSASSPSPINASPPPISDPQDCDETSDFGIHSVEEARKAFVWSEILQRKY